MEHTQKTEMREIVEVYQQGEAVGKCRGLQAGLVLGACCTLLLVVLLVALSCATGRVRFVPPAPETGPIGEPAGVICGSRVPDLIPAGGPAAPLSGTTQAPPLDAGDVPFRPAPPERTGGIRKAPAPGDPRR